MDGDNWKHTESVYFKSFEGELIQFTGNKSVQSRYSYEELQSIIKYCFIEIIRVKTNFETANTSRILFSKKQYSNVDLLLQDIQTAQNNNEFDVQLNYIEIIDAKIKPQISFSNSLYSMMKGKGEMLNRKYGLNSNFIRASSNSNHN